jgi:zinc finger protein
LNADWHSSQVREAARPYTVILDDPLANSYVQNLYAPDPDPNMSVELYDRTWQQNEELGLNDIQVENYSEDTGDVPSETKSGEGKA